MDLAVEPVPIDVPAEQIPVPGRGLKRYAPVGRIACRPQQSEIAQIGADVDEDAAVLFVFAPAAGGVRDAESADDVRKHLEEYKYPCAALQDPEHKFAKECGATVTPEAVVFDQQHRKAYHGRIDDRFDRYGDAKAEATTHELADAIAAVVEGRPVATPAAEAIGCYIDDLR